MSDNSDIIPHLERIAVALETLARRGSHEAEGIVVTNAHNARSNALMEVALERSGSKELFDSKGGQ